MGSSTFFLFVTALDLILPSVLSYRANLERANLAHDNRFLDIDSDMSRLLADSGVIREDVINKPGEKYTLKIQSGQFRRNPWISGTFKFGGAYGGLLAGGSAGGLPGMVAGGAAGMAAGDRAAETLTRILQGQGSIGISDAWKEKYAVPTSTSRITMPSGDQVTKSLTPSGLALQKEQRLFTSVREVLKLGHRTNPWVESIAADASKNNPLVGSIIDGVWEKSQLTQSVEQRQGFMSSLFRPWLLMEDADNKVIAGLGAALRSESKEEREDARITTAMLEILRHQEEGVEVVVE